MRILLALDGSAHSDLACELVAGMSLPVGSTIRVVSVLAPLDVMAAGTWLPGERDGDPFEAAGLRDLDDLVAAAGHRLERPGVIVEASVLRGHPAALIADEAGAFGADLLVVGTRGHGPLKTLMLGSVSASLVDHAPCPVLIARRPAVDRILLAHDGSAFAASAASVLCDWPLFGSAEIDVVSVIPAQISWAPSIVPSAAAASAEASGHTAQESLRRHQEVAATAVRELQRAGRVARPIVLEGHPAVAISEYAQRAGTDLVVVGTHGRTGLMRFMLGSTARTLVTHVPCSILVVRPRPDERRQEQPVHADVLVGASAGSA
jgi:nucleotide-binding universal stress UspA family protein